MTWWRVAVGFCLIAAQSSCVDLSGPGSGGTNQCALAPTPYTFGDNTAGALTTSDCRLNDGSYIDYYATTLPAGAYVFSQSSTEFDTYLYLLSPDRFLLGFSDNESQVSTNSTLKALLPAGDFILGANTFPGSTGAYNLSSASTTEVTGCEDVFVVKGTTTMQSLQTSDCAAGMSYADRYIISVRAGQSITITMTSSAVDSYLELVQSSGVLVASNDNSSTTSNDAQLTYTASQSDFYFIRAESAGGIATGAYALSIQ